MAEMPTRSAAPAPPPKLSRSIRHVFWGAVSGFVVGLAVAFALALFDGYTQGMSPLACLAYGCTLTVMLSHPAGLGGLLLGATLGAFTGGCIGRDCTPPA
jgi:hypothetical protein